jgi:two-component system LytT family response regulator
MRVVIADHESRERAALVQICHHRGGVEDLIVVESGLEALRQIRDRRPQVALLACELQDMSGFDVLRALNDAERPATIMVAPDDRFAAEALSSEAKDYLTKPISPDRLALALKRVYSGAAATLPNRAVSRPEEASPDQSGGQIQPFSGSDRLVGERAGRIHFFSPNVIDFIEADSNYIRIHVGSERFINRDALSRLAVLLEGHGFMRISRSVLLNLQRVSYAEREGRGALAFVLESGVRVVSATGFRLAAGAQLRLVRTRAAKRKTHRCAPGRCANTASTLPGS